MNIIFYSIIVVIIGLVLLGAKEQEIDRSPERLFPSYYEGPGTGHGFGFNIIYTIERHATHDGKEMAIVSSSARGEEHVEIWSPIPNLVALPNGSKFRLREGDVWEKSFRLLKRGA
ncbi:MAG: hypothetical protein WDZ75_00825 [Candidatus Paceibacterota bacterium]